jgi:hypothetical protein
MIEFRHDSKKISGVQAVQLCAPLEEALRSTLRRIRPARGDDYSVFVEGDAFNVCHNQPDLRIYVFYHPSWEFNDDELSGLPRTMAGFLEPTLEGLGLSHLRTTIRFYRRDGHSSLSFGG